MVCGLLTRAFGKKPGDSRKMSGLTITTLRKTADNGHLPRQHEIEAEVCNIQVEISKGNAQKNGCMRFSRSRLSCVAMIRGERRVMDLVVSHKLQ